MYLLNKFKTLVVLTLSFCLQYKSHVTRSTVTRELAVSQPAIQLTCS